MISINLLYAHTLHNVIFYNYYFCILPVDFRTGKASILVATDVAARGLGKCEVCHCCCSTRVVFLILYSLSCIALFRKRLWKLMRHIVIEANYVVAFQLSSSR